MKHFILILNLACNSNCTGCISETVCNGCNGTDSALRDPALTCVCKATAWNNEGTCISNNITLFIFLIKIYINNTNNK